MNHFDTLSNLLRGSAAARGQIRSAQYQMAAIQQAQHWQYLAYQPKAAPKPCEYCGGISPRCCHSTDFTSRG
jgi:hypothetical protein